MAAAKPDDCQERQGWLVEALLDESDHDEPPTVAAAGAVAGLIAETLMHPFDTVSQRAKAHPQGRYGTLFGSAAKILVEEGPRGLWAGVSLTMVQSAPATAIYFGAYHGLRNALLPLAGEDRAKQQVVFLAAGGAAELGASLLFMPLEVIKTKLQMGTNPARASGGFISQSQNFAGPVDAARRIWAEQGLRGLFQGWHACLAMDVCFSAVQFLVYENILHNHRRRLAERGQSPALSPLHHLAAGGLAGAVGALATNPLDIVTLRLMAQDSSQRFGVGIWGVLRQLLSEGPLALWRGAMPRTLAAVPVAALQFGAFEVVLRLMSSDATRLSLGDALLRPIEGDAANNDR